MMKIPVAKPDLTRTEAKAASEAVLSGWVTQGPRVAEFEKSFASYVGAKHACAVSSCTTALHLALLTLGVRQGDEVITVSHSFIATTNAILYCKATPVFVDIDRASYNLDPDLLEAAISDKTRAILCVHQMGMPCAIELITEIARKYDIPVVEDAACAVGSEVLINDSWEKIGKPHGDIACFSFHPRKVLTTGDGGMLTTNNENYAKRFELLRQHSMDVNDSKRHESNSVIFENYIELGYNYRMTDIQAAIGIVQLSRLDEIVETRRSLVALYREYLSDCYQIILPIEASNVKSNWQSFCVSFDSEKSQLEIMEALLERGISTRRGIMCSHLEPALRDVSYRLVGRDGYQLIESELATSSSLILPLFGTLREDQIRFVCKSLSEIVQIE